MAERTQMVGGANWRWDQCQGGPEGTALAWNRTQPENPSVGDGWVDPSTGQVNIWNGSSWVAIAPD
ncbi:MAG: hypothetical protein ACK47B_13280 [Armatimonadota bacterium]